MKEQICIFIFFIIVVTCSALKNDYNEWSVVIQGGLETAKKVAEDNGFTCVGQIGSLQNHYRFLHKEKGMISFHEELETRLRNHDKVMEFQKQAKRIRVKKMFTEPIDPHWPDQWSLLNTGQTEGPAGLDLNVEGAWIQNLNGSGVLVAVVDDGVQWEDTDITENYDAAASYDFVENKPNPSPNASEDEASHGTNCAGVIAMSKNDVCGVGVAFGSNIAGLRIGIGTPEGQTDSEEASALGHMDDEISIYSNSWGPDDSGFIFDRPGPLLVETLKTGSSTGRENKGSIYVWASGNGGSRDTCAADGYVNSIYTIAIGSADQNGFQAEYDENCTAKMAVTYSFNSDHFSEEDTSEQLVSIDLSNQCIDDFTGTSASTPLVSGTITLVLERNPSLTWRDIQYLIVYTSDTTKLYGSDWTVNGAGLSVSSQFGFGAIDAEALVTRAKYWTTVPRQGHYVFTETFSPRYVGSNEQRSHLMLVPRKTDVEFIEHVVVRLNFSMLGINETEEIIENCSIPAFLTMNTNNIDDFDICELANLWPDRGDISITLTSPEGTESVLLPNRPCDICQNGLDDWSFMSVHYWGENPAGIWNLTIKFDGSDGYLDFGLAQQALEFFGATEIPESVEQIPTTCDDACVRGCGGNGSEYCDSCKNYRDPVTLKCLSTCNKTVYKGYCLDYDPIVQKRSSSWKLILGIVIATVCLLIIALVVIIAIIFIIVKKKPFQNNYKTIFNVNDTTVYF